LLEEGKSTKWYWINQEENSTQLTTKYVDEDNDQYLFNINFESDEWIRLL